MTPQEINALLDKHYDNFANPDFICNDPIQIPHSFTKKEDIEISGFFASIIAWGNRKMIINNAKRFMQLMDNAPYDFVMNHEQRDLKCLEKAVHRTFNGEDMLFFVKSLANIYRNHGGLEAVFSKYAEMDKNLINVHEVLFEIPYQQRSLRHISDITKGSAAKRLNMFLRWMVRDDGRGVDFGLWKSISPSKLLIPLDVHCGRTARELGLLTRNQNDWKAVVELTENLRKFDPNDPVKYDFALFGAGVTQTSLK
ncbi:MAG: TIGR02757 family protein [Bacteroidales bacterium]|nr:TIGR02757 family protein [Bacteroidales bacterium]